MPSKRIGVSTACYLPYSGFLPNTTARWAEEDGFVFLSVLPFRGAGRMNTGGMSVGVRYIEGAWNPVSDLYQALAHMPSSPGGMKPNLLDWIFFPNSEQSEELVNKFNFARRVLHQARDPWRDDKFLLELSPKLDADMDEIGELVEYHNISLVFDTYHARRDVWTDLGEHGKPLGDAKKLLEYFIRRRRISVIHVQPMRETDELSRTLAGEETEMVKLLQIARGLGFRGPLVIEATLGIKGIAFWKLRDMLRRLREVVEKNAL